MSIFSKLSYILVNSSAVIAVPAAGMQKTKTDRNSNSKPNFFFIFFLLLKTRVNRDKITLTIFKNLCVSLNAPLLNISNPPWALTPYGGVACVEFYAT